MSYPSEHSQTFSSPLRWLWRKRSSLVTLAAGVAILVLAATAGLTVHEEQAGTPWHELLIYLCGAVIVATQGGRLYRACTGLGRRSGDQGRDRTDARR